MTRRMYLLPIAALSTALTLSACVAITPASPTLMRAVKGLQALHDDPDVARWAPVQLAQAEQAVHKAQHTHGNKQRLQHLAFMAENRVEFAGATAYARQQAATYQKLRAKRESLGGGDQSVTTLAQAVIGSGTPPTPLQPDVQIAASTTPSSPAPASTEPQPGNPQAVSPPVTTASTQTHNPAPEPSPVPVEAPASAAAPAGGAPATRPTPQPKTTPPAAPEPAATTPATGKTLLTFKASDFLHGDRLTPDARRAVHGLLPALVEHSSRLIVISGASKSQRETVRATLIAIGVPGWRLRTQSGAGATTVTFGGQLSMSE